MDRAALPTLRWRLSLLMAVELAGRRRNAGTWPPPLSIGRGGGAKAREKPKVFSRRNNTGANPQACRVNRLCRHPGDVRDNPREIGIRSWTIPLRFRRKRSPWLCPSPPPGVPAGELPRAAYKSSSLGFSTRFPRALLRINEPNRCSGHMRWSLRPRPHRFQGIMLSNSVQLPSVWKDEPFLSSVSTAKKLLSMWNLQRSYSPTPRHSTNTL